LSYSTMARRPRRRGLYGDFAGARFGPALMTALSRRKSIPSQLVALFRNQKLFRAFNLLELTTYPFLPLRRSVRLPDVSVAGSARGPNLRVHPMINMRVRESAHPVGIKDEP
jgi:hypothetical protein